MARNPFIYRGPIRDPQMFFGRSHELQQIGAFLNGNQSISIVGSRKIGKTSLLQHLRLKETRSKIGLSENYLPVYLDCEILAEGSHAEIFGQFLVEIEGSLSEAKFPSDPIFEAAIRDPSRLAFERVIRKLNKKGLKIILILDEFERLSINPSLNVNFFNALRSAAGRYQLAFITASAKPLIQLTYTGKSQENLSSPFFNIFAPLFLTHFSEADARQAIIEPAARAGRPFSSEIVDSIFNLAHGFPFHLMVASFHAFEVHDNFELLEERVNRELNPHFLYYWENLSSPEKHTLKRVNDAITQATSDTTLRGILRDLVQKSLLVKSGNLYSYPGTAWKNFVSKQQVAAPISFTRKTGLMQGTFLGPYEVLETIGHGGMSDVYRGYHQRLDRTVAIKILPPNLALEADFRARFEMEARSVAKLRHDHIVQVYDFGEIDGVYYMVMEYVDGANLSMFMKENGPLPLSSVVEIIKDIAKALDFAHHNEIIHRDVKPSNVLLARKNEQTVEKAFLTDFGIAKIRGQRTGSTKTGTLMGTLDYMAPEQIQSSGDVDHRVDIYSLAIITYKMLTGELPFKGENPGEIMLGHLHKQPPNPKDLVPSLPNYVVTTLAQGLAKNPKDRPRTAKLFANLLFGFGN